MPKKRVFVSATSRDLKSCRELASVVLRERGCDVDDQAIFNLTYQEIGQRLRRRIADCDAVVCLIGFIYGGEPSRRPPDRPRRSYTQWEHDLARQLDKPVYLLLADNDGMNRDGQILTGRNTFQASAPPCPPAAFTGAGTPSTHASQFHPGTSHSFP